MELYGIKTGDIKINEKKLEEMAKAVHPYENTDSVFDRYKENSVYHILNDYENDNSVGLSAFLYDAIMERNKIILCCRGEYIGLALGKDDHWGINKDTQILTLDALKNTLVMYAEKITDDAVDVRFWRTEEFEL